MAIPSPAYSSFRSPQGNFGCFSEFYRGMDMVVSMPQKSSDRRKIESEIEEEGCAPNWLSLFAFTTKSHIPTICTGLVLAFFAGITKPTATIFFGQLFGVLTQFGAGQINSQHLIHDASKWCIALSALGCASWFLEGASFSTYLIFGEQQAKVARERLFDGMLHKNLSWFDLREEGTGSLLIRVQTQIRELQLGVSNPLAFIIYEVFSAAAAVGIAFFFCWQLSLVILATFPVITVILYLVSRPLGPAVEAQKHQLSEASKYVNNSITAINTVKVYNGQQHEVWQYMRTIKLVAESYMIQARVNALQFGIMKFVLVGIFVQGFGFGLYLVNHGANPAHILTTFYACLDAVLAIEVLLPQGLVLAKAMSAGNTLKLIELQMNKELDTPKSIGNLRPEKCDGDIEIEDVNFAYPVNPEQNVLQNAHLFFPAGETTFIVGSSGSGKSTIGNLLMKYYQASSGEVMIDGHPIESLDTTWVRENISLVQQQSLMFNDTILQNVAFGRRDHVSRSDIIKATTAADLELTLLSLQNGIDTLVGSGGKSLSGGQQQRVAIARARLRDAPILILDEATSALDQTSKPKIMNAIREWRQDKTTIIITHDVSQILDQEYVYAMQHGKVVQEGYRKKLAAKKNGLFASLLSAGQQQREIWNPDPISTSRRMSEPALSPTSVVSSMVPNWSDAGPEHKGFLAKLLKPSPNSVGNTFINTAGNRGSVIGIGVGRANDIWADQIWQTPERKEQARVLSLEKTEIRLPRTSSALGPLQFKDFSSTRDPFGDEVFSKAEDWGSATSSSDTATNRRNVLLTLETALELPPVQYQLDSTSEVPEIQVSEFTSPKRKWSLASTEYDDKVFPARGSVEIEIDDFHDETVAFEIAKGGSLKPVSLRRILATVWPNLNWQGKIKLILGFVFAFITAVATPLFAYILAKILSIYYTPPADRASQATIWAPALIGVAVVDGFSTYVYHYLLEHVGQDWINALRVEALRRILVQPKSWFDRENNAAGRLTECLDRNAEEMRNLIGRFTGPLFITFWMISISLVWAIIVNWKLSLVALATAPLMYLGTQTFNYVSTKYEDKCNQAAEHTSSIFAETFSSIRLVRALTLESYFQQKHSKSVEDTYKTGLSRGLYIGMTFGFADCLTMTISALVFYYGSVTLASGATTTASLLQVFNLLLFGLTNSVSSIMLIPQISNSRTTATQVLYLASLPLNTSPENRGWNRIKNPFPIILKNLSFTYPTNPRGMRTLTKVNLEIKAGSCTAIVGSSGCGKSTLASLLLGLYPPDKPVVGNRPSLTFDGIPVNEIHTPSLRSHIAVVSQASQLFPATIYENIVYGLPESSAYANLDAVKRAAEDAGINEFIESLANGYATLIGEGGQTLSGGQMQRIAIARALIRRPKVLILDEATSALDAFSAESIRKTIRQLRDKGANVVAGGVAIIIITHSIEMMSVAETVVVLEGGRVVEKGGFAELRTKGGKFSELIGMERLSERDRREMEGRLGLGVSLSPLSPVKARTRLSWAGMRKSSV